MIFHNAKKSTVLEVLNKNFQSFSFYLANVDKPVNYLAGMLGARKAAKKMTEFKEVKQFTRRKEKVLGSVSEIDDDLAEDFWNELVSAKKAGDKFMESIGNEDEDEEEETIERN